MLQTPRARFAIVVHTLVFNRAGHLLLLRRANTGFMDGGYVPPGGHRRSGETVANAAVRECREEAGIAVSHLEPRVAMPYADGVNFLFEALDWSGAAHIGEPERCDDLLFAAPDALPPRTARFVREALECRAQGVWFREFE